MALVLKQLYEGYFWLFNEVADQRSNEYFLGGSPLGILTIVALWYQFVFNWGPKFMEKRPPYDLKTAIIVFNVFQVIVNGYIVFEGFRLIKTIDWRCEPIDYDDNPRSRFILNMVYLYFLTKVADLLDTVFFVLKKNSRQVTFLHTYHHSGMALTIWLGFKFVGGGHSVFLGFVNAIVHTVMYLYYLLSAYDEKYKHVLWIKKFVTQIQLIQFIFLLFIYGQTLFMKDCKFPKIVAYFFVPQNFFMIALFADFYYKSYIRPRRTFKGEKYNSSWEKQEQMASLMHSVVDNYHELLEIKNDPLVNSWLFMQSPAPVVTILVAYLYFVLILGPKLMKNRKAWDLKRAMVVYNAYQVLFSVWLCSHALHVKNAIPHLLNHTCKNPSPNKEFQQALARGAWWYFFSKIVELLDTVFFVLRKKQSQVTFLHVYHHAITMFFSWAYLKFLPGEQGVVIGFLNSLVHVVMYFYYFLAALGPNYQKYLWWKKYMTWIQLTQFCIMLAYLTFIIAMDCKLPRALTFFFLTNVVIFLYLFTDFYRKAYRKPNPQQSNSGTSVSQIMENAEGASCSGTASYKATDASKVKFS
ncbi:uncharacterized protein LOC132704208 [Cylas formicarius]|uniref:uncharacterized protein LOC132704208 n=1 Tax=Cylas formicarius TaxID=197179 RepID=UPI002958B48F|nr:uncharacterized protein LOC132704208 [Cylas formicarius]